MVRDIEDELFVSLEKYYGLPKKNNKKRYKRKYRYECIICRYIEDYQKSWNRFNELFDKYSN